MPPAQVQQTPAPVPMPAEPSVPAPTPAAPIATEQQTAPAAKPAPTDDADDIVITGRSTKGDPAQAVNIKVFEATQVVDRAVIGPVALAYKKKLPSPIRSGLRNFLGNLREPVVAVNYLLQLKPGKAAETVGRFAINSTIGIAGLMDVAARKPFKLRKRRNSFANTLGYHGVKPGPFFFLPLVGGTSLRDLVGVVFDQAVIPVGPVRPFQDGIYTVPLGLVSALDYRAEFDTDLERIRSGPDPYSGLRDFYLARRQAEIDGLRGPRKVKPPRVVPTVPDGSLTPAALTPTPAAAAIVARFDADTAGTRAAFSDRVQGDVAHSLAARVETDQALRKAFPNLATSGLSAEDRTAADAAIWQRIVPIDAQNTAYVKSVLPADGWFRNTRDGKQVTRDAFLIVQHSADRAFQRDVVARMGALVTAGEVAGPDYALLYDRTELFAGRPQRYGSQIGCARGSRTPADLEDPAHVDERRAIVGLPQLADYLKLFQGPC